MNLNKTYITKNDILKYISDIDVYNAYLDKDTVSLRGSIISPLRKEDNPSFGFFKGRSGEICWKDFILGAGDFVSFVQLKFGLKYFDALSKIASDFKLPDNDFYYRKDIETIDTSELIKTDRDNILRQAGRSEIGITIRKFNKNDALFWSKFGITYNIIKLYNVTPISHIHINGNIIVADDLAYAFIEHKDNNVTYKIYQPYSKHFKWLSNHDESVWQGWSQLPESGTDLIITKSLKDVMSIRSTTGIPAVALQSEQIIPKQHVFELLKIRFVDIYLLYDNDYNKEQNWGRIFGNQLQDKLDIKNRIEIENEFKAKDYSDLVWKIGIEKASKYLKSHIFPF